MDIKTIFINILSMSTIASIVFCFILFARKVLCKKISQKKLSLLWIVFIIVLIFPINFSSKLSIKNYLPKKEVKQVTLDTSDTYMIPDNIMISNINNRANRNIDYMKTLSLIWILFAVGSIFKNIFLYSTIISNKKHVEVPNNLYDILEKCKKKLNIHKDIKLVIQEMVKTPSLYGIFNTKILLTKEVLNLSNDELECIIMHELNHYKGGHNFIFLFISLLENIYWFNPIMYFAGKLIRQDLEFITDDLVIGDGIKLKKYCETIIKVSTISNLNVCTLPSISSGKKIIERRIRKMKNKVYDTKYALAFILVAVTIISLVTVSLASNEMPEESEVKVYTITDKEESGEEIDTLISENVEDDETEEKDTTTSIVMPLKDFEVAVPFSKRIHPITGKEIFHTGIDLKATDSDDIMAVDSGKVVYAEYDYEGGNTVKILHLNGTTSVYKHGSKIYVDVGDEVEAGDVIMKVGATGMATGPHLHFEMIAKDGSYIDVNSMFE